MEPTQSTSSGPHPLWLFGVGGWLGQGGSGFQRCSGLRGLWSSPLLLAAQLLTAAAGLVTLLCPEDHCWCSRPFRKNSFIALSRHFKYVKHLFVLGLELDLEMMREREKCCSCARIKNGFPAILCN